MKYSPSVESVSAVGVDLVPQRPKPVREQAELPNHILEPAWQGTRVLVRIGHDGPRFLGYDGPVDGPRELFDAIQAETRCTSAVLDGVLVANWEDDRDLEMDPEGNKQAAILNAEGERQAAILRAEGFALALGKINEIAMTADARTITLQYFEALKTMGTSAATKFVIPIEFSAFAAPLAAMAKSAGEPPTKT